MDAMQQVYEATCDECAVQAQQTFEGFQRAGWTAVQKGDHTFVWYCAACVYGIKRVATSPLLAPPERVRQEPVPSLSGEPSPAAGAPDVLFKSEGG